MISLAALAASSFLAVASESRAAAFAYANSVAGARCLGSDTYGYSDPQFALTLASIAGTPSDPMTCNPIDPVFGKSVFAGAVAAADLRTGEISVSGEANGGGDPFSYNPTTVTILASGSGIGHLVDVVTVVGGSGSFSFNAQVVLHVEGTLTGYSMSASSLVVGGNQVSQCVGTYLTSCHPVSAEGPFSYDLVLNVPVSNGNPIFDFTAALTASGVNDGVADASSTASLSIILPAGFSFTSESGVLLVPEPAQVSLLATVGLGLAILRRCGWHPN